MSILVNNYLTLLVEKSNNLMELAYIVNPLIDLSKINLISPPVN
jgi:hypothetical protein